MSNYIGITIGPIIDTLMSAKTPAQLWYASYMFSSLTKAICSKLAENSIEILSPYFENSASDDGGIGKYHDRIVAKCDDIEIVKECIALGKQKIVDIVCNDINATDKEREFLNNYISIYYVEKEISDSENAILILSNYLDMLEQMKTVNPDNSCNPFNKLFKGDKSSKNSYVDESQFITSRDNNALYSDGRFKSIENIANQFKSDKEYKRNSYFAIVQADGDNMGRYISSLSNDNMDAFSKCCFEYCERATEIISDFGGTTIYAGGDDLLFIAPVYSKGKTIFDIIKSINECFEEIFKDNKLSLSFGISIKYVKFPLYESLEGARNSLFSIAKSCENKNCTVLDFSKHSGQASCIVIPNERLDEFISITNLFNEIDDGKSDNEADATTNSIIYNMERMRNLLESDFTTEDEIRNIVCNQYDNAGQRAYDSFVEKISNELVSHIKGNGRKITLADKENANSSVKAFEAMLRIGKFFCEKGVE